MKFLIFFCLAILLTGSYLKITPKTEPAAPLSMPAPAGELPHSEVQPLIIESKVLVPFVDKIPALHKNTNPRLSQSLWAHEDQQPKTRSAGYRNRPAPDPSMTSQDTLNHSFKSAVQSQSLVNSFDAAGQSTNVNNTGSLFIPADTYGSVGPSHVMNVINTSIELYQKDGNGGFSGSLQDFFGPLNPVNATFDPKIIYDQFLDRWVVVTLERTDTTLGDSANTSKVLFAVSDDSNPNGLWSMFALNTKLNISGTDYWFDYPGFAVDEEVIYLTGNMFEFGNGGGVGSRLWIIEKNNFYAGNAPLVLGPYDPFTASGGVNVTTQPAHIYGNTPPSFGTYLVGYSGLTNGTEEFWETIRIDNPLGAISFTLEYLNIGDVQTDEALPEANQFGSATDTGSNYKIATNDSRALNAVWRNNKLYSTATIKSYIQPSQTSASWVSINADGVNAISYDQFGVVGGEEIANGTFTFFPAISVNANGVVALGFSASAASIFAGSYYTYRLPSDPLGTMRTPQVVRHGQDFYHRNFGPGNKNRWGDYSSMTVDPAGQCFWSYNKFAVGRNFSTGSDDDGMFATAHGEICVNGSDLIFDNGFE